MSKSDAIVFVVIIALIAGFGALFAFAPDAPKAGYGPVEVTGSTMSITYSGADHVDAWFTLKQPGFITIHESVGDAPGPLVATSPYLDMAALSTTIAATLTPGASYVALLHVDNGDKAFVLEDDMPVMSDGQVVRVNFVDGQNATE